MQKIRKTLIEKQVKVDDLQFLVSKEGRVVIADPLGSDNKGFSKKNLKMIDQLIELAKKNGNKK